MTLRVCLCKWFTTIWNQTIKLIMVKIPLRSNKKVDVSNVVSLSEGIEELWVVCVIMIIVKTQLFYPLS